MAGQWRHAPQIVRKTRNPGGPWAQSDATKPLAWVPFDLKQGAAAAYDFTWAAGVYLGVRFQCDALLPATDGVDVHVRYYINGVLATAAADYEWMTGSIDPGPGDTPRGDGSDAEIQLFGTTGIGNASGEGITGNLWVGQLAARPKAMWLTHVSLTTGAGRAVYGVGSYIAGAGALTGVRIYPSSGDWASGTVVAEGFLAQ